MISVKPALPLPAGPRGLPLVGSLPRFVRDPLAFFTALRRDYGDVAGFSLGGAFGGASVLLSHPDDVGRVLLGYDKGNRKGIQTEDFATRAVFGGGLTTSEGSFWRGQRKLAAPAFHARRVNSYAETIVRFAGEMLDSWRVDEHRDLHKEMMNLTQRILTKTLFDADVSAEAGDVGEALDVVLREMVAETNGVGGFLPHSVPTPTRRRLKAALGRADDALLGIVNGRRADPKDRDDLLAMLMEARDEESGEGMTDRQLRDEVMTLYIAGHETTANTLSWTWALLSQYPGARARLEAELHGVLGDRPPNPEDLASLPYADAIVKEVLRLYPPAWTVLRTATEELQIGGHRVPTGTQIWMSQWVVHRDGRFFEEPQEFRPERWLDGLAGRLPKHAYFPFGDGPRICIGNRFAQMEIVLLLATISQRFRPWLVGERVEPEAGITLRPKGGVPALLMRPAWG